MLPEQQGQTIWIRTMNQGGAAVEIWDNDLTEPTWSAPNSCSKGGV